MHRYIGSLPGGTGKRSSGRPPASSSGPPGRCRHRYDQLINVFRACGMFRRAPLALVNRTPARARRHARTKHVNTWTVTCTHATCAAVEACTLGRYFVLPTLSHTCTLSMASCSAVMVAGLQGWCCVSVQRGISGYRRQHSGAWHVSHPLITPIV